MGDKLDSNRDIYIKRYLTHVGSLVCRSKTTVTRYYKIDYTSTYSIKVRFSDHPGRECTKDSIDIDILKTSFKYYIITLNMTNVQFVVTEDDVLPYLRSILLVYPEVKKSISSLKCTLTQVNTKYTKLSNSFSQRLKVEAREMNKTLVSELTLEKQRTDDLLKDLSKFKRKVAEKSQECEQLKGKFNKFKSLLNSIDTRPDKD